MSLQAIFCNFIFPTRECIRQPRIREVKRGFLPVKHMTSEVTDSGVHGGTMKRITVLMICFLNIAVPAVAADLSTSSSQDLIAIYKQLRSLQAGDAASCENVEFQRDSAKFTFIAGRLTFSAPVAGRVLAAYYQGEGKFELEPPSDIDKRQIARFAGGPKLEDTFSEAVFYFTDDTYSELSKLVKIKPAPARAQSPFASSQKKYADSFNSWIDNTRKGYPVMKNMAARMLADLTESSSKGFFLADFKAKKSGDLLFHISWNRDSLLLPYEAKDEEVMLLHLNPGAYFEWWSGFHLAAEYAKSRHPEHRELQAHSEATSIDLQVANDNRISATAQMEFTVAEPARILSFNLNGILRIGSIEDESGNKLSFIQEDRNLDSDPWVILNQPVNSGEKHKIKISYTEESTRDTRIVNEQQLGGGHYFVVSQIWDAPLLTGHVHAFPRVCWFPSFGSYDDKTRYEIRARSPKVYKFIGPGIQTASEKQKEGLFTSWKADVPLSVVGFNYGSLVQGERMGPDMKVTAYALDGFNWQRDEKHVADMSFQVMQFFQFYFGALPFKAVSVFEQPVIRSGQSWPYLIFPSNERLLETSNNPHLQESGVMRDYYVIREMSHQWWGHLVGWKTYHDEWLSEGMADFAESAYFRQFEPKELNNFYDVRRDWLLSKTRLGYRPVDSGPIWLNPQLNEYNGWGNNMLINYKGSYIMEMLRMLMYDSKTQNPDAPFIMMLHDFYSTFAGKNASTEDFRKIVEKHMGTSMEWFFDQWVYGTYTPTYNFSYQLADDGNGQTEASITLAQSDVPESFHMELPVYITLKGEPQYLGRIGVTGTKPLKTSVKLPVRPEKVLLDPNRSILAEIHQ
jgi:hypothetical protein